MNPYAVLNVPPNADDALIRGAYLAAIKRATPECDPERFQRLTVAYESIKTEDRRHQYLLFDTTCSGDSPLDALQKTLAQLPPPKPTGLEILKAHLRSHYPS